MTDTIWLPDLQETRESKYIVLIQSLRDAVRSGKLECGARLPPVRDLAWKLGITPGTIRISVGLEDPADLIGDFTQALDRLQA